MRRVLAWLIGLIIVFFVLLLALSGLYEDWLWYTNLGYSQLFWTPLISKGILQIVNGTILFIFIAGTLFSIRHAILTFVNERLRKRLRLVHEMDRPLYHLSQRKMTLWLVVVSMIISFGVSFVTGFTGWLEVLSFINYIPFGQTDPVFTKDLGFYVFRLPFLITIYNTFFGPLFLLTFFTAIFYIFTGVIQFNSLFIWRKNAIEVSFAARRHLALLILFLFVFKGFGYYLDIFKLLYSQQGMVLGAGYADIKATLPGLKFLIIICLLGFISAIFTYFKNEIRMLTIPILFNILSSILLLGIWPTLLQSFVVVPNELEKENPYIQNEINLTRFAYGLDRIVEEDYVGNNPLTAKDLQQNLMTLKNVRLNDPGPLLQTYTQKQGMKQYYKFHDIDIDRYVVNGEYRQVLLSPRELLTNDLEPTAQTFVNMRFKYTHGFGVVASFANGITTEGVPAFALKDIPPISNYQEFWLKQPRIYFGELTKDWVVVNTDFKEFDYPAGNSNLESDYEGKSGIHLNHINRFMLSLKHGTLRFYLANEVNSDSRILLHRNIIDRVQKLAPFFQYDEDPYLVVDQGRLKWIIDAYTTSKTFPYSRMYPDQEINYIRNSVKVVIDAYDGTVDFYAIDLQDPILQSYRKIFPEVFKDLTQMSISLQAHLRYPETLFTIQSNMLKNFHMVDTTIFYNKVDAWDIAKELFVSEPQNVNPYYTVLQLPGNNNPEFVLTIPFTPASSSTNTRNNMVAWLAARMDGEHYGELRLYKVPKNVEVDGPFQIESRIDQDAEISKQLALWDQKGSKVIRGNLLVLPIAGNFLYVEPVYLQSAKGGSIPEMTGVVVVYEGKILMTETFEEALAQLFGVKLTLSSPQITPPPVTKSGFSDSSLEPDEQENDREFDSENNPLVDPQSLFEQIEQLRELINQLESQLKRLTQEPDQAAGKDNEDGIHKELLDKDPDGRQKRNGRA